MLVKVTLTPEEVGALDGARGLVSRSAWVRDAVRVRLEMCRSAGERLGAQGDVGGIPVVVDDRLPQDAVVVPAGVEVEAPSFVPPHVEDGSEAAQLKPAAELLYRDFRHVRPPKSGVFGAGVPDDDEEVIF